MTEYVKLIVPNGVESIMEYKVFEEYLGTLPNGEHYKRKLANFKSCDLLIDVPGKVVTWNIKVVFIEKINLKTLTERLG